MNLFERILRDNDPIICDICGKTMIAVHGGGWEHDIIYCSNTDCGAEIVFPTTTEYKKQTAVENDDFHVPGSPDDVISRY